MTEDISRNQAFSEFEGVLWNQNLCWFFRLNIVFSFCSRRRNPKKSIHSWLRASNRWWELHLHSFPRTTFLVLHGERNLPTHLRKLRFQPQEQLRRLCERESKRSEGKKRGGREEKRGRGSASGVIRAREHCYANVQPKHCRETHCLDGETGMW